MIFNNSARNLNNQNYLSKSDNDINIEISYDNYENIENIRKQQYGIDLRNQIDDNRRRREAERRRKQLEDIAEEERLKREREEIDARQKAENKRYRPKIDLPIRKINEVEPLKKVKKNIQKINYDIEETGTNNLELINQNTLKYLKMRELQMEDYNEKILYQLRLLNQDFNNNINSLKEEIEKLNKRNNQMNKFLLENEDNNNNNLNLTERYTKNHISNYLNIISDNKEIRDKNNTLKYYKYQRMNLQSTHYNKIKKKIYSKKKSEGNKTSNNNEKKSTKENTNANLNSNDLLSTTRNEYTQKLKPKLNKYFSGNNINRIGTKSCNKKNKNSVNQYLPMNNSHIGYRKYTHLFSGNKNNKINNLYSVKKIIANSALKGLRPNSSTKISNKYRGFIYKSASGDN